MVFKTLPPELIETSGYLFTFFQKYLFDPNAMTDGNPPNDRGCRACGKIGVSSSVIII